MKLFYVSNEAEMVYLVRASSEQKAADLFELTYGRPTQVVKVEEVLFDDVGISRNPMPNPEMW